MNRFFCNGEMSGFRTAQVEKIGISRPMLRKYTDAGKLEQVRKGLYVITESIPDEFLPLAFTGLCINIGLFAHLVIMWAGPLGKQVKGLFYGAPSQTNA